MSKNKKKNRKSAAERFEADQEERIESIKISKAKSKSLFTRRKNQLLDLLESGNAGNNEIRQLRKKTDEALASVLEDLAILFEYHSSAEERRKTQVETERIEAEYDSVQAKLTQYLDSKKEETQSQVSGHSSQLSVTGETASPLHYQGSTARQHLLGTERKFQEKEESIRLARRKLDEEYLQRQKELEEEMQQIHGELSTVKSDDKYKFGKLNKALDEELGLPTPYLRDRAKATEPEQQSPAVERLDLGKDMWKQLTRVSIPVFKGEKRSYESWKAAFMACIDQAPATSEYKLLQLRQYLSGEALKVVEGLGHSAAAYQTAKDRLERKYGGQRRRVNLYLDELDHFRSVRPGNAKDLDSFADLLDMLVVNLRESKRLEELGNGSLYLKAQKKLSETMLVNYHRWIYEQRKPECVETLREWVIQEAEFQTVASETIRGLTSKQKEGAKTFFGQAEVKDKLPLCKVCKKNHPIWRCDEFKAMDVSKRWYTAKKLGLCYRCLGGDHMGGYCTKGRVCGIDGCQETHNRFLHGGKNIKSESTYNKTATTTAPKKDVAESRTEGEKKPTAERSHTTMEIAEQTNRAHFTALRTVPVKVKNGNQSIVVNALLDDASTKTYLNADVAAELGLVGETRKITVNVLNGQRDSFETMPVEFELESLDGRIKVSATGYTTEKVTGDLQPVDWNQYAAKWKHLRGIKFPNLGSRPTVDILIGIDLADLHYSIQDIRGKPGEPVARLTPLGWTCIGGTAHAANDPFNTNFNRAYFINQADTDLNQTLQKFWEIDSSGSFAEKETALSPEESYAMREVSQSLKFKDGRYEVAMPWKPNAPELPNNYDMAMNRLKSTERRLLKNEDIGKAYNDVIAGHLKKGYISKVQEKRNEKSWYLPHFAIVRPGRETTKTRIVFDASAKCNGVSLNDAICQGPKLQRDLVDVLLRFRRFPVALVCDIAEMYLRIGISPVDRQFHKFLWRDLDQSKKPEVYQFNSLVFGVNSCPFQAQFVAQEHARKRESDFPRAAETVLESTYMDDSMDSAVNEAECIKLYRELSALWESAGMHARKWLSNSKDVLQQIPEEDRAAEVDLDKGSLPAIKTLGILWVAEEDIFTYKVNPPEESYLLTKRNFLRKIATLFDPLGFLNPYVIRAKILLQEMWTSGLDWDDLLDENVARKAKTWFAELQQLSEVIVPRCLQLEKRVVTTTIHTFTDASGEAYAAAIYARQQYEDGSTSVRLIVSKSRVAPLSATSIPRLELMGAILGLRLAFSVAKVLKVDQKSLIFWTDSMNVLWWIRKPSRGFKPFVANRIGEIQSSTNPEQWRHVSTKENPADLPTRGTSVANLKDNVLWWSGPEFLKSDEKDWPKVKIEVNQETLSEVRKQARVQIETENEEDLTLLTTTHETDWRLQPERYSNWNRLVRVRAWVQRFIENCTRKLEDRCTGDITYQEIADAETAIIKEAQRQAFSEESKALTKQRPIPLNSKLLTLKPVIDQEGLLRSDGRLTYAEYLPFDVRYPIILPRKHWVTKLIVKNFHEQSNHSAGTNHTLSKISARFWIMQGREEIREWEAECFECRRRKTKAARQIMAPLPKIRLKLPLRAFARTAVDYAGPFITVQGRGKKRMKRYLCLFTCLTSRAVHLEMAYALDTDSFLNAFYRMAIRRGLPEEVISDNGSNFVGAERELKELVEKLDQEKIKKSAANKGIKWYFNPPLAPHFGGVHETMIKAAKRAAYAILKGADVTDEELTTAFIGAEGLLNSRPITYQSANPMDDVPLTPNHFLFGQVGGQFAPESVDTSPYDLKKRWRRIQELVRHFWHRWLREWLPSLNRRTKWKTEQDDIQVGEVVLIIAPDTPRGQWPLGKIVEIYPGPDNHVRAAKVQIGRNTLIRPITKICPLGCFEEIEKPDGDKRPDE